MCVQFFDGMQTLCGGVLRGAGLPTRGTIMNFIGYYLVGVPLGAAYVTVGTILRNFRTVRYGKQSPVVGRRIRDCRHNSGKLWRVLYVTANGR